MGSGSLFSNWTPGYIIPFLAHMHGHAASHNSSGGASLLSLHVIWQLALSRVGSTAPNTTNQTAGKGVLMFITSSGSNAADGPHQHRITNLLYVYFLTIQKPN